MSDMVFATPGVPFHGEFSSTDARGVTLTEITARMALYAPGDLTPIVLGASDIVWITDMQVTVGTAMTVTLYDGPDNTVSSGEVLFKGSIIINTTVYPNFTVGKSLQKGSFPHVLASVSGNVDVQVHGTVQRITS